MMIEIENLINKNLYDVLCRVSCKYGIGIRELESCARGEDALSNADPVKPSEEEPKDVEVVNVVNVGKEEAKKEPKKKAKMSEEEKQEKARIESEKKAEKERIESEKKAEKERIESEKKAEKERIESEKKAEKERIESEKKAEKERIESEKKAEKERIESEKKAEKARIESEKKAKKESEKKSKEPSSDISEVTDLFASLVLTHNASHVNGAEDVKSSNISSMEALPLSRSVSSSLSELSVDSKADTLIMSDSENSEGVSVEKKKKVSKEDQQAKKAEKERKEQEKKAEKERIESEKKAEKERKEQEKKANKSKAVKEAPKEVVKEVVKEAPKVMDLVEKIEKSITASSVVSSVVSKADKESKPEKESDSKKVKAKRRCIEGVNYLITSANLVYLESSKELMGTWCVESESIMPMEESDDEEK